MATNHVHAGKRVRVLFDSAHTSGDLIFVKGHIGIVEETVANGDWGYIILGDAWLLPGVPATVAMGVVLGAPPTVQATRLPLLAYAAGSSWVPVGRTIATGNATVAKVNLFGNVPY
jgi:predicted RecA/RadA family phage recombinase